MVLIYQVDVFEATVVELEVTDMVIVELARPFYKAFPWAVEKATRESLPLGIGELHPVERLQLHPCVGQQLLGVLQVDALVAQAL